MIGRRQQPAQNNAIQQAIAIRHQHVDSAPDALRDGTTIDKQALKNDVTALMLASAAAQNTDLLYFVAGLAAYLSPTVYLAQTSERTATGFHHAALRAISLKAELQAAGRPDLAAAVGRLQAAQLSIMEDSPAGRSAMGIFRAVAMREGGQLPADAELVPFEGWYIVDAGDGLTWRYCNGTHWTDQFAPL